MGVDAYILRNGKQIAALEKCNELTKFIFSTFNHLEINNFDTGREIELNGWAIGEIIRYYMSKLDNALRDGELYQGQFYADHILTWAKVREIKMYDDSTITYAEA